MNKFPDFYQERKSLYVFDGFQSFSGEKKVFWKIAGVEVKIIFQGRKAISSQ